MEDNQKYLTEHLDQARAVARYKQLYLKAELKKAFKKRNKEQLKSLVYKLRASRVQCSFLAGVCMRVDSYFAQAAPDFDAARHADALKKLAVHFQG